MAQRTSLPWSTNTAYTDLNTMHFWIDKRGAGSLPMPPHGPRSRHRVAASLSSGVPQRRRRYSSARSAPKYSGPGAAAGAGMVAGAGVASRLAPPGPGPAGSSGSGPGPPPGPPGVLPPRRLPGLLLTRAALPRPHLAYIGSTGSGVRSPPGLDLGRGPGTMPGGPYLPDTPPSLGHSLGHSVGFDTSSGPAIFNKFTCGLWASLVLASVFVAGTKFYLDFQSSGKEALVLSLLLMVFLLMGCIASVCRARVNSQLAAAAAAAAASVLDRENSEVSPGPSAVQSQASLSHSDELAVRSPSHRVILHRQPPSEAGSSSPGNEPPPPYHIVMLADEQPPPAYEKVVN